jgi:hypothetical protein
VLFAVAKFTVTGCPLAADSDTVKVALVVPVLPSVTVTSLIASDGVAIIIGDRAKALVICDGRVDGVGEVDEERFVGFVEQITDDWHGECSGESALARRLRFPMRQ